MFATIQQRRCHEFSRGEHRYDFAHHFPQHIQSVQRALESGDNHTRAESPQTIQKHQPESIQRLVV